MVSKQTIKASLEHTNDEACRILLTCLLNGNKVGSLVIFPKMGPGICILIMYRLSAGWLARSKSFPLYLSAGDNKPNSTQEDTHDIQRYLRNMLPNSCWFNFTHGEMVEDYIFTSCTNKNSQPGMFFLILGPNHSRGNKQPCAI